MFNAPLSLDVISIDPVLHDAARAQVPLVTDPEQAQSLVDAVLEALTDPTGAARVEFRAGSIWKRKGYDTAGDLAAETSPSPYRNPQGDDEVYLCIAVRLAHPDSTPAARAFVDMSQRSSQRALLEQLEKTRTERAAALSAVQAEVGGLDAQITALRDAIDQ